MTLSSTPNKSLCDKMNIVSQCLYFKPHLSHVMFMEKKKAMGRCPTSVIHESLFITSTGV